MTGGITSGGPPGAYLIKGTAAWYNCHFLHRPPTCRQLQFERKNGRGTDPFYKNPLDWILVREEHISTGEQVMYVFCPGEHVLQTIIVIQKQNKKAKQNIVAQNWSKNSGSCWIFKIVDEDATDVSFAGLYATFKKLLNGLNKLKITHQKLSCRPNRPYSRICSPSQISSPHTCTSLHSDHKDLWEDLFFNDHIKRLKTF